jgi:hypothetical protein
MLYPAWRIQQQRQRIDGSCAYEQWAVCCVVKNVCKLNRTQQTCYIYMLTQWLVHNVILATDVCFMSSYIKHLIIFQVYSKDSVTLIYKYNYKYIYGNITFVLHIVLYLIIWI